MAAVSFGVSTCKRCHLNRAIVVSPCVQYVPTSLLTFRLPRCCPKWPTGLCTPARQRRRAELQTTLRFVTANSVGYGFFLDSCFTAASPSQKDASCSITFLTPLVYTGSIFAQQRRQRCVKLPWICCYHLIHDTSCLVPVPYHCNLHIDIHCCYGVEIIEII